MAREPVLVIDDNAQNLKLARVILAGAGYDVRTATDAEDALIVLETFTPSLILMDIQLPRMDGLELTRLLKADPARRDITIIALSASVMLGDHEKAIEAGCDGFLAKPIDTDLMMSVIAGHLERRSDSSSRT